MCLVFFVVTPLRTFRLFPFLYLLPGRWFAAWAFSARFRRAISLAVLSFLKASLPATADLLEAVGGTGPALKFPVCGQQPGLLFAPLGKFGNFRRVHELVLSQKAGARQGPAGVKSRTCCTITVIILNYEFMSTGAENARGSREGLLVVNPALRLG